MEIQLDTGPRPGRRGDRGDGVDIRAGRRLVFVIGVIGAGYLAVCLLALLLPQT